MQKLKKARQSIGLLVSRNTAARHRVLETMRYLDDGRVKVRIGGPKRGKWAVKPSRAAAVRAVRVHYDVAIVRALRAKGWTRYRKEMDTSVKKLFRKYQGRDVGALGSI